MGMYGSYFFVFIRAVVCIIWYGIQTFYAASIFSVMLRCIFGDSWQNFENTFDENADITSKTLLAFFIVWLFEFPFVCLDSSPSFPSSLLNLYTSLPTLNILSAILLCTPYTS